MLECKMTFSGTWGETGLPFEGIYSLLLLDMLGTIEFSSRNPTPTQQ